MSWNVQDQDWLTEPTATTGSGGSGPIDKLDGQVLGAMGHAQPGPPTHSAAPPGEQSMAPSHAPLPPPPPSAAFEQHERPTYESGAFVADEPAAEFSAAAVEPPSEPPIEQPLVDDVASAPDFHIPTLAFGVGRDLATHDSTPQPELEPKATSVAAPVNEPGLVLPTLSRLKWVPAPSPSEAPQPASPRQEAGHPEMLEQVDSSELELVAADDARKDPAGEVDFVIPTLARPETADRLDISLEPSGGGGDVVIPTLMRAGPPPVPELEVERAAEPQADQVESHQSPRGRSEPAPVVAQADEVEEFEEVEADVIESLDAGDLVETDAGSAPPAPPAELEVEEAKPRSSPPDAKPQQKRRKAWYDDVFAEHFMFLFPQTWDETAQRDAQFIHDQLGLREGASVLDVGCGDGRHAIELAKLGLHVTGLDNSLAMLLAAAQQKEAASIDDTHVTFIHGDMRRLPRDREFEAVICVGTTFGYFEEEQNRQCLQEMFDRLAVGGRLLLHVFNRDFVAPHLPSRSWWQGRRCMVIDEAEMNFFANRLRVHRTIIFDDGRQFEHFMFMRAYTVQDIGKAISALGLRVVEVSGSRDTRARFYGAASPDIWIVAERK